MSGALGTAVERDGALVWSGDGRPLTHHELRLRDSCGRLWLPLFDGVYLLILRDREAIRFERAHQRSVMEISGAFLSAGEVERRREGLMPPHGGEWAAWRAPAPPTREQMMELLHAALVGGGKAVVGRQVVSVSPARATDLIVHRYGDAPVSAIEPVVSAILRHFCDGASPTPEERAAFTIGPSEPVVPAWALAA